MPNTGLRHAMTNIGLLASEFCKLLSLAALFGSKGQAGPELTLCNAIFPQLHGFGADSNGQIRGLVTGDGSLTFARATGYTVADFEGLGKTALNNELRFIYSRRGANLATGLVTETLTVINGHEYQLTIAGGNGDTAICSGAFSGTLTANGTDRISWPSGIPKTSASTSLTITVTGSLTQMLLEDVTYEANQNPGEDIPAGEADGTPYSYVGGVRYNKYQKGNTAGPAGIVTEAKGPDLTNAWGALFETAATNVCVLSTDFPSWSGTPTVTRDQASLIQDSIASTLEDDNPVDLEALSKTSIIPSDTENYTFSLFVLKDTDETRFPGVRFTIGLNSVRMKFSTKTGASTTFGTNNGAFSVKSFSDDWWRIECVLANTSETFNTVLIYPAVDVDMTPGQFDGTATGSIVVDAAQIEHGGFATSYIPTIGTEVTRAADNGASMFDYANWAQAEGTLVLDLVMRSEQEQGIFNVANAQGGVLSYDSVNKFQTDDGANQASVDPSLGSNLGNTIRLAVGYKTGGDLFIGYKNITDAGPWVWDTDEAGYGGAFATNGVINMFYGVAAVSIIMDLFIYKTQQDKTWIEANF